MKTKTEQIEELKATAVKLQRQIAELEKPKQWEPRDGYYAVLSGGFYIPLAVITADQRKFGVVRQTKEAAEKASDAMRTHNRLLAYVDEFGGDWEADWSDSTQEKGYVYYNYSSRGWSAESWVFRCCEGAVYMSRECAKDLAAKLNSGEVVL